MSAGFCFCLVLWVQAPAPPSLPPAPYIPESVVAAVEDEPAQEEHAVERYRGTFAEGAAELERLALAGDTEEALAVSDALLVPGPLSALRSKVEKATHGLSELALAKAATPLEWAGVPRDESNARAEVHYARGLVYAQRAELEPSMDSFELARVLAGPGETRLDAVYNQGTLDLLAGEGWREQIPEIAGNAGQPAAAGAQALPGQPGQAPGAESEPDPLEMARAAYLSARTRLVERLTGDWRDADARANVELVMRRLAELDEIEREREKQEQEQEQNEDQDSDENSEEQDQDQQDESQEKDQQEQSESESESESENESEEEQSEEQESEGEEPQEDEPEEPEEQEGEEQPSEDEAEQAAKPEPQEVHLTEEEAKRLLERLEKLDEEGELKRLRFKGSRRVPVKRDW